MALWRPTAGTSLTPLEDAFDALADSIEAMHAFTSTLSLQWVANLGSTFPTTPAPIAGDLLFVQEGRFFMQYSGSAWEQITEATFTSSANRDTAYARASAVYKVAGRARAYRTDAGIHEEYNGAVWASNMGGLVPIIPTAAQVTGATVSRSGLLTFTTVSSFSLNNVFNDSCDNYLLVLDIPTKSTGGITQFRLRLAGVDDTTASSYQTQATTNASTTVSTAQVVTTYGPLQNNGATIEDSIKVDIFAPALGRVTRWQSHFVSVISSILSGSSFGRHTQAVAYDGITVAASTGTFTGTGHLYGYAK